MFDLYGLEVHKNVRRKRNLKTGGNSGECNVVVSSALIRYLSASYVFGELLEGSTEHAQ